MEHKCKNCLLFNKKKLECRVAILINGEQIHLPVNPEDNCHIEEIGIEVDQVRWIESKNEKEETCVKIEYPNNFFK